MKEDRRVKYTKRVLKESLSYMLETSDIDHISITELCEIADINRSTFYRYYGSQYDLLKDIENDYLETLEKELENESSPIETLNKLLSFIKNNLVISKSILNERKDYNFKSRLLSLDPLLDNLNSHYQNIDKESKDYLDTFIISGGYSLIVKWVKEGCVTPVENLSSLILGFVK